MVPFHQFMHYLLANGLVLLVGFLLYPLELFGLHEQSLLLAASKLPRGLVLVRQLFSQSGTNQA